MHNLIPIFQQIVRSNLIPVNFNFTWLNRLLIVFRRISFKFFYQCWQQGLFYPPAFDECFVGIRIRLHKSIGILMNINWPFLLNLILLHYYYIKYSFTFIHQLGNKPKHQEVFWKNKKNHQKWALKQAIINLLQRKKEYRYEIILLSLQSHPPTTQHLPFQIQKISPRLSIIRRSTVQLLKK